MKAISTIEEIVFKDEKNKLKSIQVINGRYPSNFKRCKPLVRRKLRIQKG